MARTYYKLDLMARALRSWHPLAAIALLWRIIRTNLLYEWKYVYGLEASELHRVPAFDIPGYHVDCLSGLADIERLEQELREYPGLLPDDALQLQAAGALFWVGRVNGVLANIGVSRYGAPAHQYFWPLMRSCAVLSHFGTVPQFRGRGLYPALLAHILQELAPRHVEYFLIECGDWNTGSRRGIEHAGFQHIGFGKATVRGRLSWHPLPRQGQDADVPVTQPRAARPQRPRQPVKM